MYYIKYTVSFEFFMENIVEIQTQEYKGYRIEIATGRTNPLDGVVPYFYGFPLYFYIS